MIKCERIYLMQLFKEDDDKETVEKDIVEFAPRGGGELDISLGGEVRPGDSKTAWLIAEPVSLYKHTRLFLLFTWRTSHALVFAI